MTQNKVFKENAKMFALPMLVIVVFFSLLFSFESLELGQGLGREVNFLTNDVREETNLTNYKSELRDLKIELNVFEVDQDRLMLKFIGVDDVEAFERQLLRAIPTLEIYETGTFNSISTVNNTSKTLQSYIVVFLFAFVTMWTYRFRLWGLYFSIISATMSLSGLFILNSLGYIFNFNLWFTFLMVLSSLVILKSWTINNLNKEFDIDKIVKNHSFYGLVLSVTSIFLLIFDRVYFDQAVYIGLIALYILVEVLLLNYVLPLIKEKCDKEARFKSFFEKRGSIKVPDIVDSRLMVIILSVLMIVVAVLSVMDPTQEEKHYRDFSKENYLIVDNSDASSFLEVQASLGRYDLSQNLLEYKISEEKKTWYVFDEFSTWQDLIQAKSAIEEKLDTKVSVIQRKNFNFTYDNKIHIALFAVFTALVFVLHYVLNGSKTAMYFIVLSMMQYLFVLLFLQIFRVHFSLKFNVLQALVPLFVSGTLLYIEDIKLEDIRISSLLGFVTTIIAFLILPIVLLIPDPNLDHYYMISLILVFALSFIASIFIFYYNRYYTESKKKGDI